MQKSWQRKEPKELKMSDFLKYVEDIENFDDFLNHTFFIAYNKVTPTIKKIIEQEGDILISEFDDSKLSKYQGIGKISIKQFKILKEKLWQYSQELSETQEQEKVLQ